jgi:hypothetical protein
LKQQFYAVADGCLRHIEFLCQVAHPALFFRMKQQKNLNLNLDWAKRIFPAFVL